MPSTPPLDRELAEKTLEAWVQPATTSTSAAAASISVQTLDGNMFDAIVFGEKEPRRWMAGSDFFRRTQVIRRRRPTKSEARERLVHVAIVYHADGTIVGLSQRPALRQAVSSAGLDATFAAGKSQIVFGLRHGPPAATRCSPAGSSGPASTTGRCRPDEVAASAGGDSARAITEAELLAAELDEPTRASRSALAAEDQAARTRELESLSGPQDLCRHAASRRRSRICSSAAMSASRARWSPPAASVAALPAVPISASPPDAPDAERRKKLAEWITSAENPLFARAIVNRVWHYHFGRGLVETPNDLGFNGGQPTHPRAARLAGRAS